MKKKKKGHPFRLFLICWLVCLALLLAVGLKRFHAFLLDYEVNYTLSLPAAEMDRVMEQLTTANAAGISNLVTTMPPAAEGESDEDLVNALLEFLDSHPLSYSAAESDDNAACYHILSEGRVIGEAELRISPLETLPYGLPSWYLSTLEFYELPAAG
ncbi:MAG: hypothetical protein IK115_11705 [Lachnospiraceae bacterium]|nr:hypothetical protein [Lachnospiraceae bacterium]